MKRNSFLSVVRHISEAGEAGWGHMGKRLVWIALLIKCGLNLIGKGESAKTSNRFVTKLDLLFVKKRKPGGGLRSGEKTSDRKVMSLRRLLY